MKPRVLAARLDSAGDMLLTGPAIRALAEKADELTLLCGPRGLDAAQLLPGVDSIIVYEASWIDAEPGPLDAEATLSAVKDLASREIDEAVIFTSFHQSALPLALLLRMAGIGRISAISEDYPGSLLDVRHRVSDDIHEVERSLSLARAAGYELAGDDDGRLRLKPFSAGSVSPLEVSPPYIVVHPGASVPARSWAPEHHAALVKSLAARGHRVVVTGGPSEMDLTRLVCGSSPGVAEPADSEAAHPAVQSMSRIHNAGGLLSLSQLAIVLRNARAVVVGNTGPAHLAAAVGTPVVSLFAPTVPSVRWRPWKVRHILLGNGEIACAGCRAKHCPVPGHPCLDEVSVAEVEVALDGLLEAQPGWF